jgi:hypothetical protein
MNHEQLRNDMTMAAMKIFIADDVHRTFTHTAKISVMYADAMIAELYPNGEELSDADTRTM